jgi:hypothetical protein
VWNSTTPLTVSGYSYSTESLAELIPEIPLYNVTRLDAVPATLRNFKGNPTNTGIFWNVWEWDVEGSATAK